MLTVENFEKLMLNTRPDEVTGCLQWLGQLHPRGYPVISLARYGVGPTGQAIANRVVFQQMNGKISARAVVYNTCGNRGCLNVGHMKSGTRAEAFQNASLHGRVAKMHRNGALNPMSKLTAESVAQIRNIHRAGGQSLRSIGSRFGVSPSAVSLIVRNKRWAEVANAQG